MAASVPPACTVCVPAGGCGGGPVVTSLAAGGGITNIRSVRRLRAFSAFVAGRTLPCLRTPYLMMWRPGARLPCSLTTFLYALLYLDVRLASAVAGTATRGTVAAINAARYLRDTCVSSLRWLGASGSPTRAATPLGAHSLR